MAGWSTTGGAPQNATYTADVQDWEGTSNQLAVEREQEGGDRALYTMQRKQQRRSKEEEKLDSCKATEQAVVGRASMEMWKRKEEEKD